jgi:predicted GIY-YIG superfamily endonuclease
MRVYLSDLSRYGSIYVLTNMLNGKQYVGQTKDLKKRKRLHLSIRGIANT